MIYVILVVVFLFVFIVNKTAVASIEKMSNPSGLIERVDRIDDAGFLLKFNEFDAWAQQNGFAHDCFFLAHTLSDGSVLQNSAWWSEQYATWALLYYHKGKHFYDFVSELEDGGSVTTASSKDGLMLPRRSKKYMQAFPNLSFDGLLQKHQTTLQLCIAKIGMAARKNKTDIIREIEMALAGQMSYVKTIPFWRHRGIFWYFFRRNFLINKPIKV